MLMEYHSEALVRFNEWHDVVDETLALARLLTPVTAIALLRLDRLSGAMPAHGVEAT